MTEHSSSHYLGRSPPYSSHHEWSSSGALSPDPTAPGPSGHYFQSGDYFAVTRTASVPIPTPRPIAAPSPARLASSSSESLSPLSTAFTSASPATTFSSDTSAAMNYSSTTSISEDQSSDVLSHRVSQAPGGFIDPGFQFRLNPHGERIGYRKALLNETEKADLLSTMERTRLSSSATRPLLRRTRSLEAAPIHTLEEISQSPFRQQQHTGLKRNTFSMYSPTLPAFTSPNVMESNINQVTTTSQHNTFEHAPPLSLSSLPNSSYPNPNSQAVYSGAFPYQLSLPHSLPPINPFASPLARDALLTYAHRIYNSPNSPAPSGMSMISADQPPSDPTSPHHAYTKQLLPLLITLRNLHPTHIPTLLLFGCVLYTVGDLNGSLYLNSEILRLDPNYVEAMSNIGSAMKALGRTQEAEAWWWKAIRLRPTYWDATDNLLGVLCTQPDETVPISERRLPRYTDAFLVCEYVQSRIFSSKEELIRDVPPAQRHRVQNLLYTIGNLYYVLEDKPDYRSNAISRHFEALNLLMRPWFSRNEEQPYEAIDVIIAVCVAGLLAGTGPNTPFEIEFADVLGLPDGCRFSPRVLEQSFDLLGAVHNAGPRLTDALLRMGGGILPMTLLLPDQVQRLPSLLFVSSAGVLPGLCTRSNKDATFEAPADTLHARRMTSTVLLTLARIFQYTSTDSHPILPVRGNPVRGSTSLVLLFHYLALAIHPSPATCNNMGIILSSVSTSAFTTNSHGHQEVVNGQVLAKAYYMKGLSQDGMHPHLLTNLGSLLKDQGKVDEAIHAYAKAIQVKPDFDVALANMGNAIKDTGRPQESIIFYRRAVQANPAFHEAVCGLANALSAVCDWRGRGGVLGEPYLDNDGRVLDFPRKGWINKVIEICDEQLLAGYAYGVSAIQSHNSPDGWLETLEEAFGRPLRTNQRRRWEKAFSRFFKPFDHQEKNVNEGGVIIRFIEHIIQITQRKWYIEAYGQRMYWLPHDPPLAPVYQDLAHQDLSRYKRPSIPKILGPPPVPSVLPFHTFTYPLSPRTTRLMSYRNALRISYMTQTQSWLPRHVYPPPPPLPDKIKIGYVSNDLNNHPLAHLTQSVFGFHDRNKFEIYVYATSPSDKSRHRLIIEEGSEHFLDVSSWSTQEIVERIVIDGVQLLVNLGGYTKGARNDIFAARPAPVQLQFMGFAGTLAAGWCDYLVSDVISCPPDTCCWDRWREHRSASKETSRMQDSFVQLHLETDIDNEADPESLSQDWMYTEHMIYMPHSFFVTDHKQSSEPISSGSDSTPTISWYEEEKKRLSMRRQVFPDLPVGTVVFANFNQLYKVDPPIFATWLRILDRVPNSVLWLLRFPAAGEEHIIRTAKLWAEPQVVARIFFTDVVPKDEHLRRARMADLMLDTVDCNAHTIAADVLWSGTPIITWPKHRTKMCSRVGASIATATGFGQQMVVGSLEEYESRAIRYGKSVSYDWIDDGTGEPYFRGKGELINLRRNLFLGRDNMPLFDTLRWTRNLEKGFTEAWRRWVAGTCFENSDEWEECNGPEKDSGSIWVKEDEST